jgi:GNAT superfamily N-acetyltransferase
MLPASPCDFVREALRLRARVLVSEEDSGLLLFRVTDGDEECAIVALRAEEGETDAELDEIFVDAAFRGRGLGGKVIERVVDFCRALGRTRITVWAHPLDDDSDEAKIRLVNWYEEQGFSCSGAWDELERTI